MISITSSGYSKYLCRYHEYNPSLLALFLLLLGHIFLVGSGKHFKIFCASIFLFLAEFVKKLVNEMKKIKNRTRFFFSSNKSTILFDVFAFAATKLVGNIQDNHPSHLGDYFLIFLSHFGKDL